MQRQRKTALLGVLTLATVITTGALFSGWEPLSSTAEAADDPVLQECPDPTSPGMREVLDALKAKERALERRARSIEAREGDLRRVEDDLQARLDELATLRAELRELLEQGNAEREARVDGLVKMVENMRSKQAATVVSELEDDLAVEVLDRMNRGKAGKMLAAMDPSRAADLAEQLTVPVLWEDS